MKRLMLFFVLISTSHLSAQQKFQFNEDGILNTSLIVEIEGSSETLYNKTIEWVNFTYRSPEDVISGTSDNKFLRFSGIERNLSSYRSFGTSIYYDLYYTFRIDFKDGRYRITVENAGMENNNTILWDTEKNLDAKTKKMMGKKIMKALKTYQINALISLNLTHKSLQNYLSGKTDLVKNDW